MTGLRLVISVNAMVYLAERDDYTSACVVAKATGASHSNMTRALSLLIKDGLLKVTKGPTGGYRLARGPEDITILEIARAIGEGSSLSTTYGERNRTWLWEEFDRMANAFLTSTTLYAVIVHNRQRDARKEVVRS